MSRLRRFIASTLLAAAVLPGCANLDAVREFGKTAAGATAYPDAGKAFQESATATLPYRAVEPTHADTLAGRAAQAQRVTALHAALSSYFATLAKLAGEDAFSLDKELDAVAKGLQGLPGSTTDKEVSSAIALIKILVKYAVMGAQQSAVREMIDNGGTPAMAILDHLKDVTVNWKEMATNDAKVVNNALGALATAKDAPVLAVLLARDRQQQMAASNAALAERLEAAAATLDRIKVAHAVMEKSSQELTSDQLRAALKTAVADIKAMRTHIAALD